jgi:8-oxo-dGTP diphosphatase
MGLFNIFSPRINRPKVGVGVLIRKDGKVLIGKRKNAHGAGEWSFPGGHLEYHESPETACSRETMEEAGITIKNVKPLSFTNDIFPGPDMHYITLYFVADYASGEVKNMEPHKCEGWEWHDWNNLPQPLFQGIEHLKQQPVSPMTL